MSMAQNKQYMRVFPVESHQDIHITIDKKVKHSVLLPIFYA